jgi:hypothetical protein
MSKKIKDPQRSGRAWAYVGTVLGVAVSAAANAAETMTNPAVPDDWERWISLGMGLLPVGLFVALEVLVRNRIKQYLNWWRGAMLLAAVAFAVPSYSHMHDLLQRAGQNDLICIITPLGWDSVMLLSTLALLLPPGTQAVQRPIAALTAHGEPWLAMRDEMRALTAQVAARAEAEVDLTPYLETVQAEIARLAQETGTRFDLLLSSEHGSAATVRRMRAPRTPPEARQRLKPHEYTFWDDFVAAQRSATPWDDDRMLKELRASGKPDATPEAARGLRKRWVAHLASLTPEA